MDNAFKQNQMYYTKILTLSTFLLQFLFQVCYGQSNIGDWEYRVNEFTNKKSIITNASRDDRTSVAARFMIKSFPDGTATWELLDSRSDYAKLSSEQIDRISIATIYVYINGVNQEFDVSYGSGGGNYITPELKTALCKGTKGAVKFPGIPYYYKFSLKGLAEALNLLEAEYQEIIRQQNEIIRQQQETKNDAKRKEDEKRYELIDQLYLEEKIEEAKSEMDKLNFPENYKNKQNCNNNGLAENGIDCNKPCKDGSYNLANGDCISCPNGIADNKLNCNKACNDESYNLSNGDCQSCEYGVSMNFKACNDPPPIVEN